PWCSNHDGELLLETANSDAATIGMTGLPEPSTATVPPLLYQEDQTPHVRDHEDGDPPEGSSYSSFFELQLEREQKLIADLRRALFIASQNNSTSRQEGRMNPGMRAEADVESPDEMNNYAHPWNEHLLARLTASFDEMGAQRMCDILHLFAGDGDSCPGVEQAVVAVDYGSSSSRKRGGGATTSPWKSMWSSLVLRKQKADLEIAEELAAEAKKWKGLASTQMCTTEQIMSEKGSSRSRIFRDRTRVDVPPASTASQQGAADIHRKIDYEYEIFNFVRTQILPACLEAAPFLPSEKLPDLAKDCCEIVLLADPGDHMMTNQQGINFDLFPLLETIEERWMNLDLEAFLVGTNETTTMEPNCNSRSPGESSRHEDHMQLPPPIFKPGELGDLLFSYCRLRKITLNHAGRTNGGRTNSNRCPSTSLGMVKNHAEEDDFLLPPAMAEVAAALLQKNFYLSTIPRTQACKLVWCLFHDGAGKNKPMSEVCLGTTARGNKA
ncbi:unnamed protein product, partial [Amoebophrya sp. A120]